MALPRTILINCVASSSLVPTLIRTILYRMVRLDVSWGASLSAGIWIRGSQLHVKTGSTVNFGCLFDCRVPVSLGSNCGIGHGCRFITTSHEYDNPAIRAGKGILQPIRVGDGVWIGSGVTILPGVTIGDGAVIAAGSVVTRDCKPHCLYGGVPARELRSLPGT
jgi:maltose O-acetyltransferase